MIIHIFMTSLINLIFFLGNILKSNKTGDWKITLMENGYLLNASVIQRYRE